MFEPNIKSVPEEMTNARLQESPPFACRRAVPRVALTPNEAAESLGCSAEFFREHIDRELRWIRRGRKRFVAVVELERWAEANAEATR